MTLVGLRSSIVTSLDTEIAAFQAVQPHGGKFNRDELKRIAMQSPAALVTILGGKVEREGGQAVGAMNIVVFIVTRGTSIELRDEAALILAEAVAGLAVENKWDYADAKAPESMQINNLFTGKIDALGVALWSASWIQQTDLAIYDSSTLDDFHRMNVKWDLADKDGVVDMEDDIWLNGEFMSAYGHLYASTAVATSIAVADTYQKAAGTTTLKTSPVAVDFDMPANNRLRHTGSAAKPFLMGASGSITVSADAKVTLALAEDGVVDADTEQEVECTLAEGAEPFSLRGLFDLALNEYVEVWVKADDTVNVTLTKMNMVAAST